MDTEERERDEPESSGVGGSAGTGRPDRTPKVTLRTILADGPVRTAMVGTFVAMLGFGMVGPVLPLFARSFGVGYGAVAVMISAYALTRLVLDVVAGPVVKRMGERASATTGVLVTGVAGGLTAAAPTFALAVVAWGAAGAGSALMFTAMYSYLLKVVPETRRARTFSVFWGSLSVSFIAGAPIGGALARIGLAVPLWAAAGMSVVAGWMFFRYLRNPPARTVVDARRGGGHPLREMLRMRAFRAVLFINLGLFWLFAAINTVVPLFAQRSLGLGTVGISAALTVFVLTELAVLYPAGIASDRFGRKWLLVIGLLGLAITTAALGLTSEAVAFAVLLGVGGIASGVAGVSPPAMLGDLTPEDRSAVSVAAYRFCGDLGYVVGPLLAGITAQFVGFAAAFVVAALPTFLSVLFLLSVPETRKRPPETAPPAAEHPASPLSASEHPVTPAIPP
ncbi:MAG TPA: MFS transporter [Actinomycetota bacterium]